MKILKQNLVGVDLVDFFSMVRTKNELELFHKEIDQILHEMFESKTDFTLLLDRTVSIEKKNQILSFLQKSDTDVTNLVKVQEKLELIKELGGVIPVISLHLSFEPTEQIVENLSLWLLRNVKQKVLLDINLDRGLLGGAYLSLSGVYFDGSLRTKVETILQTQSYL